MCSGLTCQKRYPVIHMTTPNWIILIERNNNKIWKLLLFFSSSFLMVLLLMLMFIYTSLLLVIVTEMFQLPNEFCTIQSQCHLRREKKQQQRNFCVRAVCMRGMRRVCLVGGQWKEPTTKTEIKFNQFAYIFEMGLLITFYHFAFGFVFVMNNFYLVQVDIVYSMLCIFQPHIKWWTKVKQNKEEEEKWRKKAKVHESDTF